MMKLKGISLLAAVLGTLALTPSISHAGFVSGSTGADGDFAPTANSILQIPETGIFNFGTVNIPSGVTVSFKKNEKNTGVTILASGDVTIDGRITVDGSGGNYIIGGAGGPGGFDGGVGGVVNGNGRRGQGPGGAAGGTARTNSADAGGCGGGGGFSGAGSVGGAYDGTAPGGAGGPLYGNERILPLIGGSGGAGGGGTNSYVGGAGGGAGGALLVASSGTITVNGTVSATGGGGANGESSGRIWYYWGYDYNNYRGGGGGGGAGGSIRLVANVIKGNGGITANAGDGGRGWATNGGAGSAGRIRLEAQSNLRTTGTSPPLSVGYPYAVIPPNMPSLAITSIGAIDVPAVPKGAFGSPDVTLPFNTKNPITIVVTGTNVPVGTTVTLKATPEVGSVSTGSGALSGTDTSSDVSIPINIVTAYPSLITATVTFQLTAANGGPIYVNGERIDKVRVAANLGGASSVVYITESGKEIPAVI